MSLFIRTLIMMIIVSVRSYAVVNTTSYDFDELYEQVAEMIGLQGADVLITYLPNNYTMNGDRVNGFVVALKNRTLYSDTMNTTYVIYLRKGLDYNVSRETLVHEMVHVFQDHTKRFEYLSNNRVLWNGYIPIDVNETKYEDRIWEIEANLLSKEILKTIKNGCNKNKKGIR
jgi:hypothetical protein